MCTLVIAAGLFAGLPLVVIANRDEAIARPSSPPLLWPAGFVAPRDDLGGGTWLGQNRHGVFVGITNRFLGIKDESRRSRGEIVALALAEPSARAVEARVAKLDPRHYSGFHLVYADREATLATASDGTDLCQVTLGRGAHIVTERSFGAGDDRGRRSRIEARLNQAAAGFDPRALAELLAEHDADDPLAGTCIHLPEAGYGTRSSAILATATDGSARMWWAEGAPCVTSFAEVSELFRASSTPAPPAS